MITPESKAQWKQVAELKLRLRDHVRVHRHHYRGNVWYVLANRVNAQYYRFGVGAYDAVRLMDGERTVEAIWQIVRSERGEDALSQTALVELLSRLHENDLLHTHVQTDLRWLLERQARAIHIGWKRLAQSPFLVRVPLLDPEPFLRRPLPGLNLLFGGASVLAWLLLVIFAAVLAASYWPDLKAYWSMRGSPRTT